MPLDAQQHLKHLEKTWDSLCGRLAALEKTACLAAPAAVPFAHITMQGRPEDTDPAEHMVEGASPTQLRLAQELLSCGVTRFAFKRVPEPYYSWPLERRQRAVGAASVYHL